MIAPVDQRHAPLPRHVDRAEAADEQPPASYAELERQREVAERPSSHALLEQVVDAAVAGRGVEPLPAQLVPAAKWLLELYRKGEVTFGGSKDEDFYVSGVVLCALEATDPHAGAIIRKRIELAQERKLAADFQRARAKSGRRRTEGERLLLALYVPLYGRHGARRRAPHGAKTVRRGCRRVTGSRTTSSGEDDPEPPDLSRSPALAGSISPARLRGFGDG